MEKPDISQMVANELLILELKRKNKSRKMQNWGSLFMCVGVFFSFVWVNMIFLFIFGFIIFMVGRANA